MFDKNKKAALIDELVNHIEGMQFSDLMALKNKVMSKGIEEVAEVEGKEMPEEMSMGKPKGIAIEKVEVLGKKPEMEAESGEEEMSDDELKQMLAKYLK